MSNSKLRRVFTPRSAVPSTKTALERAAVLREEGERRREIAWREWRVYLPAKRRHLVQSAVGPGTLCALIGKRRSGRVPSVTPCRIVTVGRRPLPAVTPQPRRPEKKKFYRFIDDEAEEVPHELAVLEDEAIPAEWRPGYDTDQNEGKEEEESERYDEASDPT